MTFHAVPTPSLHIVSLICLEHLSDGTPVYMANDPRLPGCSSDGATVAEAQENLRAARIDYINSMIDDGLEPPDWYNPNEHWEPVE